MEESNRQNFVIALMFASVLIGVIYKALTYPEPEIIGVYQAEVILAYRTGGSMHDRYNCDLRLNTGLVVNALCFESSKEGDKVLVAKVKRNGSSYVIQEFASK